MSTLNDFLETGEEKIPDPPVRQNDDFYTTFKVKFESQEDMEAFFDIVDQKFHRNENKIEFPPRDISSNSFSVTDFLGEE